MSMTVDHQHRFADKLQHENIYTYGPLGNSGQERLHWRVIARCECGALYLRNDALGNGLRSYGWSDDDYVWVPAR